MRDEIMHEVLWRAGGVNGLARRLGITPPSVSNWRRVPPSRVTAVTAITGIPAHDLRPDIFPPPAAPATLATPPASEATAGAVQPNDFLKAEAA